MGDQERSSRAKALRETVFSNTIEDWVEAQMRDIAACRDRS
jgi:trehalose 6-phosphate synthase